MANNTPEERLRAIPAAHAQPDPRTLASLPKGGVNLLYMGHAEVTLALIDVDPLWTWEPVAMDLETGGPRIIQDGNLLTLWGYLTVCGVRRLCVGTCEARKAESSKELLGDALRNGAMRFGIGTKLWSKAVDAEPVAPVVARKQTKRDALAEELFELCKAASAATKAELRALAERDGRRIGVQSFLEHPDWADLVRNTLADLTNKEAA
jgi:hypothetical protein